MPARNGTMPRNFCCGEVAAAEETCGEPGRGPRPKSRAFWAGILPVRRRWLWVSCSWQERPLFYIRLKPLYLPHSGKGPADVGDGDGASDDQGDVEGINNFITF